MTGNAHPTDAPTFARRSFPRYNSSPPATYPPGVTIASTFVDTGNAWG